MFPRNNYTSCLVEIVYLSMTMQRFGLPISNWHWRGGTSILRDGEQLVEELGRVSGICKRMIPSPKKALSQRARMSTVNHLRSQILNLSSQRLKTILWFGSKLYLCLEKHRLL